MKNKSLNIKLRKHLSFHGGFTLIELLIVIAIIGVLTALLTANFVGVRQRARDSQRKADLRQIQSALEFYRADNGTYPTSANAVGSFPTTCGGSFTNTSGSVTYMPKVPCDPLNTSSTPVYYSYSLSGSYAYTLIACLENSSDSQKDSVNVNPPCNGTTNFSYTLVNP